MAFPVVDTYNAPSGGSIKTGRFGLPAWRSAMTANTWATIPATNTLDDLNPANNASINPNHPSSPEWGSGQQNIINAWCGACFDEIGQYLWLPLGGGHADYGGNEPYKIKLDVNAPVWEMVRNPSGAIGNLLTTNDSQEATGLYADGRPRSIHSYNKPVYVPNVGPVIAMQGSTWKSGQSGTGKSIWINPITGEMDAFKDAPASNNGTSSQGGACYDSQRHAIWKRGSGTAAVQKFDIATQTWTNETSLEANSGNVSLEYIPQHDVIVWARSFPSNEIAIIDCATGAITVPPLSGSLVGASIGSPGQWRYVEVLNAIAYWDNATDTTNINLLNIPADPRTDTWAITQLPVDAGNAVTPTAKAANGTFGRFFYSKKLNGFGVLNSTSQDIYFFAL